MPVVFPARDCRCNFTCDNLESLVTISAWYNRDGTFKRGYTDEMSWFATETVVRTGDAFRILGGNGTWQKHQDIRNGPSYGSLPPDLPDGWWRSTLYSDPPVQNSNTVIVYQCGPPTGTLTGWEIHTLSDELTDQLCYDLCVELLDNGERYYLSNVSNGAGYYVFVFSGGVPVLDYRYCRLKRWPPGIMNPPVPPGAHLQWLAVSHMDFKTWGFDTQGQVQSTGGVTLSRSFGGVTGQSYDIARYINDPDDEDSMWDIPIEVTRVSYTRRFPTFGTQSEYYYPEPELTDELRSRTGYHLRNYTESQWLENPALL